MPTTTPQTTQLFDDRLPDPSHSPAPPSAPPSALPHPTTLRRRLIDLLLHRPHHRDADADLARLRADEHARAHREAELQRAWRSAKPWL